MYRKKIMIFILAVLLFTGMQTGCAKELAARLKEAEVEEKQEEVVKKDGEILPEPEKESENQEIPLPFQMIAPKGEKIEWAIYSEGIYCYSNGSLWGYVTEDGEEITPCIYAEAAPFSEGLACVCKDGKYGYIGKDGEEVIPFLYDQAASFREGRAYFSCGEEYGLLDKEGNVAVRLKDCDSISSFREGLTYFSVDGRYGYMDKNGNTVIEPVYDDAGYFYEGMAVVVKDGFGGVIGKDGKEIIPLKYIGISTEDTCIIAQAEDKFYFFSPEGSEISSGAWDWVSGREEYFCIYKDNKMGFADRTGKIIFEPIYEYIVPIPEKELVIVRNEGKLYGIMDYEGQLLVPFYYSEIRYPNEGDGGFCVTVADTGKTGYLDGDDFSMQIPADYDGLQNFTKDRAVVQQNGKYGIIRYHGTLEMPIEYDKITLFSNGSKAVWQEETVELTDSQGNRILTGEYDSIQEWGNGYRVESAKEKGCRYYNSQGMIIAEEDYSWPDSVYGAENSHVLYNGVLLQRGEENGQTGEKFVLTNQITPRAGLFAEFLKNGEITTDTTGPVITQGMDDLLPGRRFCKLYRIGKEENLILYFYAEPWEQLSFPLSDSGLFMIRNGQLEQLIGANECGGSLRGDTVCFWYDSKEGTMKLGTEGTWGGWGGIANTSVVYELKNGQAVLEASFAWTREEDTEEYTVNGKTVSEEAYASAKKRYRYYTPIDLN